MRIVPTAFLRLVPWIACVAVVAGCERPSSIRVVRPSYVSVCTLAQSPDALHTVKVVSQAGQTWWRGAVPGLDLSYVDLTSSWVNSDTPPDGQYAVEMVIRSDHWGKYLRWLNTHKGRVLGFFVDGMLRHTAVNERPECMSNLLYIEGFKIEAEARDAVAIIRRGG